MRLLEDYLTNMLTMHQPDLLERELAGSGSSFYALPWLGHQLDRTGSAKSGVTVMVVDDNEQTRRIAARMLRDEGYHVLEAGSGEQALERLEEAADVQVLLTDIAMPGGMDGLELARRVTDLAPWRRVVLMSGYSKIFPHLSDSRPPFPLLIKPFSADQLARQVKDALRKEAN
jgi:CheY-like chemotaxis protein